MTGRVTRHIALALSAALVSPTLGCAPPDLLQRPAREQRALGETAVSKVCGYELDVESTVSFEQEYNLATARRYLDEVVPADVANGQLSQYFTLETIGACAANLEWGGVNFDVQRLVKRYGTEAEVRSLLEHSRSVDSECRFSGEPESEAFVSACRAMGFIE
jgi:hypothetical protein